MAGCCPPRGYDAMFDRRQARRDLRRWRDKGLHADARDAVDFLSREGAATVLEIGGGIGATQVELLRGGAERTVNVELSGGYEEVARELAREEGVEGRVERRIGDAVSSELPDADAVLLVRVVCCYADYEALLAAAAGHARRFLVFTFPRSGPLASTIVAVGNLFLRLRRRDFRAYAHPRSAMLAAAERHGLRLVHERRALVWETAALVRR
ncbi:MAG: methyltransferase domain-containing protein [Pseudomonadota bacterium]